MARLCLWGEGNKGKGSAGSAGSAFREELSQEKHFGLGDVPGMPRHSDTPDTLTLTDSIKPSLAGITPSPTFHILPQAPWEEWLGYL